MSIVSVLTLCVIPAQAPAERPPFPVGGLELNDRTLGAWRRELEPDPAERAWERVPWLPSFTEGVQAAEAQGRPLLLWAMNGHPLGCT